MAQNPTAGQSVQVLIHNFAYNPTPVNVPVGGSVVWVNNDNMTHTATADDDSWDTGDIPAGASSSPVKFSSAGASGYHCDPHPAMKGTVQVS
jgi:plastocyanin